MIRLKFFSSTKWSNKADRITLLLVLVVEQLVFVENKHPFLKFVRVETLFLQLAFSLVRFYTKQPLEGKEGAYCC